VNGPRGGFTRRGERDRHGCYVEGRRLRPLSWASTPSLR
jgi:hypothetical protein